MAFFEEDVPRRARVFVTAIVVSGALALSYSLASSFSSPDLTWLFLVLVTVISGVFPVRLPFLRGGVQSLTVTVSDVFVFAALLLYSPEVAVTISFTDGISASLRAYKRKSFYKLIFNFSQLSLSTWVVGHIFYRLIGSSPPLDPSGISSTVSLFLNLGLCTVLHFGINAGLVAVAVGLATRERIGKVFTENLLWASLTNIAGAAGAAIIFLNFKTTPFFAFAVTMPIILVIYYAYKMNLKRINSAQNHLEELDHLYHSTITSLAMAIDAKDHSNYGNIQKVKAMTMALAGKLKVEDENTLKGLQAASLLHDIGKLAVPEYILNKPGKLTEVEAGKVRNHPAVGADILETVPFPYPVASFVRHHHERWDGSGYPNALQGDQIPLGARIIAVVDCFFGLRSDRPFRPRLSRDLALNFLKQESGRAFDPAIVKVFLENIDDLEAAVEAIEPALVTKKAAVQTASEVIQQSRRIERTVFHDIASTHREMQAVYEISQNIGRSLSVKETLSYLSSKIKRFVPYSACAIYLVNSEDDRLLPHYVSGMYRDILEGVEVKLGDGVTGWVAAHNQSLMNVSPELDFPNLEALRRVFRGSIAIPLSVESSVVGVITLYSDKANNYHEQHLRLMETIAPHSAAAISNAIIYEETQEDAYTDSLTGLPNIRYFNMFIPEELKRAKRIGYPVTLLMMDLDNFKSVNDRYGHQNGDAVLVEAGRLLRGQLRKSDTCLRYGGDEFLAVLPGLDKALGSQTSQRIQAAFDTRSLVIVEGEDIGVGISIGVATFPGDGLQPEALVAVADREMYRDKTRREEIAPRDSSVLPFEKRSD